MVHAKNYETTSTFVEVMQKNVAFFRTRCTLLGPTDKTPHCTAPDPKLLGNGTDQTPQRTGDPDTHPRGGTDQQLCPDLPCTAEG